MSVTVHTNSTYEVRCDYPDCKATGAGREYIPAPDGVQHVIGMPCNAPEGWVTLWPNLATRCPHCHVLTPIKNSKGNMLYFCSQEHLNLWRNDNPGDLITASNYNIAVWVGR